MSLGGVTDPDQIGAKQLHAMADDLGVRATVVLKAADSLSEQLHQTMPEVVTRFADTFGLVPDPGTHPDHYPQTNPTSDHTASRIITLSSAFQSDTPSYWNASHPEHQDNLIRSSRPYADNVPAV